MKPMLSVTPNAVLNPAFSDPHFVDQSVWTGLTQPTTVRFASDGRAFVAEKAGIVKEFDSLSDTTPTIVVDLHAIVHNFWDRGLLSIALDPKFLQGSPYLYLYLVYDAPLRDFGLGTVAPVWSPNNTCPSPPGATSDGCVVSSEVLRVAVNTTTNIASGSPQVLVHDWCQQFPSHSGGAMAFDSSGNLVVTGGDGASFNGQDYGQRGGTLPNTTSPLVPLNPCNDPETVVGSNPGTVTVATAEGGSLRSQQVRISDLRSGMSTTLDGTVIRINPATGAGVATNPLASSSDANQRRIVANGLRNPFRMTSRPGTDELYVGDVGDQTWEEIDMILPPNGALTPTTLPNFGWPCYEGPNIDSAWQSLGTNLCTNLYNQPNAVTRPVYAYSHAAALSPTGPCFVDQGGGTMSSSISGLAFYEGASGGSIAFGGVNSTRYKGALFFTDYSRNCLGVLFPDASGRPDPTSMQQVASNLSHPVDLVTGTGAGGDLFYVDLDGGIVHRISYHLSPTASAAVTPSVQLAPSTFHLDASGSTDPDPTDHITLYDWYLSGQSDTSGTPDVSTSSPTYDWLVNTPGVYTVRLKVETQNHQTASTSVRVDASDAPPVPVIDTPAPSLTWMVGDTVSFSGHATDVEDGAIPAANLTWELVIHHCPSGLNDCHLHFIQTLTGVASGSFVAPDHEYPSYLELRLTAKDSHGASTTTSISLQPKTAKLTASSSLPDVHVFVDGVQQPIPAAPVTFIKGGQATVTAPTVVTSGGKRYRFSRWTDSASATHDVVVATDMSIIAQYVPDAPDTCAAATTSSPVGGWITDNLSGYGDEDWFMFTLTSTRRVYMTLGSLPVDAKLELRSSCTTILATSDHAGIRFEQIVKELKAGTYRLRVVANGGASSPLPYAVRFRPIASAVPVLSTVVSRSGTTVRVSGEVLNNASSTIGKVTVTATFLNGSRTVATLRGAAFAYRLTRGAVSPFRLSGTVPTYTSIRLTTSWTSPATQPRLTLSSIAYNSATGKETGTLRNTGTSTARYPAVSRTWYGARGEVLAVGFATGLPRSIAPGRLAAFTVIRPGGMPTLQASAVSWRAIL